MENEEKDCTNKVEGLRKNWGPLTYRMCLNASKALREFSDLYFVPDKHKKEGQDMVRGCEIKEWGLSLDALLINKHDDELKDLERRIL